MIDETFGAQLRSVRQERGLRQWELASDMGVNPRHISQWENGHTDPRLSTIRRLAAALKVSAAELLEEE